MSEALIDARSRQASSTGRQEALDGINNDALGDGASSIHFIPLSSCAQASHLHDTLTCT